MQTDQLIIIDTESTEEMYSQFGCVEKNMRFEPYSAEVLKRLREERGIGSQRELAEQSGIPESTIKKLEASMSRPSSDTLAALGRFFGLYFYIPWEKDSD